MGKKLHHKLPENYQLQTEFSLAKNSDAVKKLSRAGVVLFVILSIMPTLYFLSHWEELSLLALLLIALSWFPLFWLTAVTHIALEYAAFWFVTGQKPDFKLDFKSYAYTVKPDFYFKRNLYLQAQLFPLVVMTGASLLLMPLVSLAFLVLLQFSIAINMMGAVVKLMVAGYLWQQPPETLVYDEGLRIRLFVPGKTAVSPQPAISKPKTPLPELSKEKSVFKKGETGDDAAVLKLKEKEKL
jgi:hypothetical protein